MHFGVQVYLREIGGNQLTVEEVWSVSNLTKEFGEITALDRFNLSVNHGIFGLVGPNGAGKTTLLRILIGLIEPDEGRAQVLGMDACQDSLKIRQRVGVLHENPLYPASLKVSGFLERVSRLFRTSRSTHEVLEMVGLHDAKNRRIGELSAGMRQRLGVAQALVGNPELVFLDEPTSNLDVIARRNLLTTISDVHETEGVAFCIISHVLSELERVCTDVAFINRGRTIAAGPITDVISEHSANHFSVFLSNPKDVFEDIKSLDFIERANITGTKSITVVLVEGTDKTMLDEIKLLAKRKSVQVYEIEKARSLEHAFMEVMKLE